jgi:hypothetical protein
VADEVDGTVDQYPPEVRVLTLAEQLDPGLDANFGAALDQLSELLVGQASKMPSERRSSTRKFRERLSPADQL